MSAVLTTAQVVASFGDPLRFLRSDGTPMPAWERMLELFPLPAPLQLNGAPVGTMVKRVRCHHRIVPFARGAFESLHAAGHWSLLKDYGGCYCWRTQRMAASRSRHSWGIAFDLNVVDNPFLAPPSMPEEVVATFKGFGFAWGGDWTHRPDGMHFEFIDTARFK